jgi:glycosyltransferase involved in cell wall biosynthesis
MKKCDLTSIHLALFFTRPFSLKSWHDGGMLERELAIYRRLRDHVASITLVTYGDQKDAEIIKQVPEFDLVCNKWGVREKHYVAYLEHVWPRFFKKPAVFKSNQVLGSEVGLAAARAAGAKFIARCGNLRSLHAAREAGHDSPLAVHARKIEREVFPAADRVILPTQEILDTVLSAYPVNKERVSIIPNYVDTELFSPAAKEQDNAKPRLLFIGRLETQKNVMGILEAIVGLDVSLEIIGRGSHLDSAKEFVKDNGLAVEFRGVMPNTELPRIMNQADIYLQPSLYEGLPKTILEAMSCGRPVVTANAPGIREFISHKDNAYLCETSPASIREALQEVLSNAELRQKLGQNARAFVVNRYSLDLIVDKELELLEGLCQEFV